MEKFKIETDSLKTDLSAKFEKLYKTYETIKRVVQSTDNTDFRIVKSLFEEKKQILKNLKDRNFYIAFIGPYSTGKSTFINALFNRDFLPENDEKATTAFPTFIYSVEKAEDEKAIIHYHKEKQREELKKFYLKEVKKEIRLHEKIEDLLELSNEELLEKIQTQKQELETSEMTYNENIVKSLERLIKYWDDEIDNTKQVVTVEESKKFVENNEKSIIIDSIDIYLFNNIVVSKDIVLVDLPGVDADNPRHYEVTRKFTIESGNADAFVVITSPNKIENDTLNTYLRELSKRSRQLEKAFWVVNRCDDNDNPELAKLALKDKVEDNRINLIEERLFATSAKLYKSKMQGISIPQDKIAIVDAVDNLRATLSEYLKNKVFKEFLDSIEKDFQNLKRKLSDFLQPRSLQFDIPTDEIKDLIIVNHVDEKIQRWIAEQRDNQKQVLLELKEELNVFFFFDRDVVKEIKSTIERDLKAIPNDRILVEISQTKDINRTEKEEVVRFLRKKIPLNELIRGEFYSSLENGSLREFLERPKQLIKNEIEQIENPIIKDIDEILTDKNLRYRLEGLCDAALQHYADLTDRILQGTIGDHEGANKLKALIVTHFTDKLEEVLLGANGQELTSEKTLIEYILNFPSLEGLKQICASFEIDETQFIKDDEYIEYCKIYSKYSIFKELDKVAKTINWLVRVSLTNHFKDVKDKLMNLIENPTVRKQMLYYFMRDLKNNPNQIDNTKLRELTITEAFKDLQTM
jgi:GTPase Era involved in 16S rRNA processing